MVRPRARRKKRLKPSSPRVAGRNVHCPFVAIVGRPNVGKSTLFNRLIGQRIAITEPTAGTTRDRIAAVVELEDGRFFEVCDTGGIGGTGDAFDKDVDTQIELAMAYADMILMVVDARAGLVPLDEKIARKVKKLKKPVMLVANKAETATLEATAGEFYALGLPGEVQTISALEGHGRSDLLEQISQQLFADVELEEEPEEEGERLLRVAIVGRRNVGKSTYVNRLFGEERVIVSSQEGTTRDAVDVRVAVGDREIILIDTAGLRKRGRADDQIEVISHGRAKLALRRCDVALLFLDCLADIRALDKKLAGMIQEEHKACVIVANKWDLVTDRMSVEDYSEYCTQMLPNLTYAPVVGISAKEGLHDLAPVELALDLYEQSLIKVGTSALNRALAAVISLRRPRPYRGKIGKVYFGTQIATNPVTILAFVNDPQLFSRAYRRYMTNQLRQHLDWKEIPIKLVLRARESLYKKGGGLARRVKKLSGLAEQARWVDDQPSANVRAIETTLDAQDVQHALLDAFEEEPPGEIREE